MASKLKWWDTQLKNTENLHIIIFFYVNKILFKKIKEKFLQTKNKNTKNIKQENQPYKANKVR